MPVRLPVSLWPGDRPVVSGADLEDRVDAALPADGPRYVDPAAVFALYRIQEQIIWRLRVLQVDPR